MKAIEKNVALTQAKGNYPNSIYFYYFLMEIILAFRYYPLNDSKDSNILECVEAKCLDCNKNSDCRFHQLYGEGSVYEGFYVNDRMRIGPNTTLNKHFQMDFG